MKFGTSWHTELLKEAALQIEKGFPPLDKLSDLATPLLCLNKDGKLAEVREKGIVIRLMRAELTEPRNFLEMVRQLPADTEYSELVVHQKPYLTTTVNIIRQEQP